MSHVLLRFLETDPSHHILDTLEQCVSVLTEQVNRLPAHQTHLQGDGKPGAKDGKPGALDGKPGAQDEKPVVAKEKPRSCTKVLMLKYLLLPSFSLSLRSFVFF